MDVIDRINSLLANRGETGAEMSRALGLSNSIYSQWNTRKTKPSARTLSLVAEHLNTTVEYLTTGTGPKEKAPTPEDEREIDDETLKAAFWGGEKDLSSEELDALWEDVREYARYKAEQRRKKKHE